MTNWEKKKDEFSIEGISIMTYQRRQFITSTDMIRAECVMRGVSLEDMTYFNKNYEKYAKQVEKWFPIRKYVVIEKGETE